MDEKIKRLRKDRIKASILIFILIGCVALLTVILLTATNVINIDNLSARVTSLNANVADASGEVTPAASYDELTYKFNITKDASDEAIITGTLTDNESKYARFKETSNSVVSENGKKIVLTTTSSKPKITVIVSNAPYGTVINPSFTINSEDPNNKNITVDPVTITSNSIEGTIKDENNNLIGGLELSLYNADGEMKRTYADGDGKYVFSLPEEDEYFVKLEEEKYRVVRYEELTTNENKRILNIIVEEVTPFTLDLKKTINKLDLVLDGKKETFNYDDETKVIKNIKKASTIEGSIYYKIYIKNIGDIKGSLTQLKDILHKGLSFDETKNPGWELKDGNLYYTILDGKDIDVSETVEVNLVLDIKKTNEAKNYINEVIGKGETFKNVVYILDNNIYKEEYVIEGEKIDNITPTVENFGGWYTDRKYTNKYNFDNEVTKNLILYGKIENNKYDVTFIDKKPSTGQETIIETKTINEGETVDFPTNIPEHVGYTFKCFTLNDECISELEVREDTTLYTDYTVNEYDITYDYDGGSVSEDNPDTYTVKDEIILHNPEKEGYTFLGWTGTDVSEPTLEVTIPRGSTGNRNYTAHFEIKRSTLTINPRGGSYEGDYGPIIITEDYGTMLTISESARRGYTFKRYNKVGGGTFNDNVFTFDDEDAELNAVYEIDTYTISYDNITPAERETLGNPVEYNVETETFELANPETRIDIYGYPSEDFLGWDDGEGNVSLTVTIPKGSIGDKSYTAVWKINQNEYHIVYDYVGGELDDGVTNIGTFTRETPTFTVNNPHRNGYNFTGWTGTGLEELTMLITIPTNSVGDRSYVANYNPINYTISYDGLTTEEEENLNNPVNYNIETETFQLANPSAREDEHDYPVYDFLGWDDGEGNVSINVTIPKGSTGDKSYTARWKDNEDEYAITYDEAGGSYPEGVTNPNTYKRKTATFQLHNPEKEGYEFDGWSGTDIEGLSTEVIIPKGSVGPRSYVAHFTPITYTISYDRITEEERATLSNPTSYNIESGEIRLQNPGRRVDAQGLNSEDFVGWDDGSGNPSMQIIIPTGSMGNKNYTATWVTNEDPYGITYELNGGAYDPGVTNPSTYTRLTPTFKLNNPHKIGYDFDGWTTDEPGSTPVLEVTIEKGSAGDREYYANYTPITYPITYDTAGGTVSGNPENYTIESNEITLINPSKNGYIFDGWSGTGITGTSKNVKIPTGSTGERSYVAHFTPDTYRIDYELNGGSATNPGTYTIESNTITLNNPTKTGYTFTGWSGTDLVGDDNQSVSIPTGSIGNRSYEAHYSLDTYTITYDYNEGALNPGETNPGTYTYESETITFKTPKKTGYTFRNYTLEGTTTIISEIPTHSTGNKNLVANYDIDRFNIYFYNGEELFGSELVDYNTTVTPLSEDPTKAHHIFLYWSEDGVTPYNYDTLITDDKNLYAVYEEVVSPTISFNPSLDTSTNKTWTCDNSNDNDCGVTVTITPAANDYETYYKVGDGGYVLYTGPFKVYNNETVSAFSKKSNINSAEVSETINNIDKINPTIDETSFEAKVAAFSIKLTGNIVDNESGIKYYELYILDQDRDLLPSDLPYTTSDTYPGDHEDVTVDFRFTGLQNLTEYKMFVKAYDYVGNSQLFSIKAETTDYVARIVGRGNIPYSDESQWEKFESLQDAIDSCGAIQCTIQLNPEVVNEAVEINEYQDITLDIDNKLLTSSGDYTVKVNEHGEFTLIDDSNEHGGKITNTFAKAIINNGRFTLGSGSTETLISLPTEYPVIEGAVIGLDNYGTFYFFDGYVKATDGEGHSAAVDNTGAETITQYPYNIISTKDGDMLVESLKKVDDPEARIKSVYYTKLNATTGESAIPSTNNGTYENTEVKLLSQIKQYGEYGFIYNPTEDSIRSANDATYNSEAISYVKVDLRNYDEAQYLLINTSVNTLSTSDYGYVSISETYGDLSNKVINNITGLYNGTYRVIKLEPKKTYYIYFGFKKATRELSNSSTYFKVNSASILNTNTAISDLELVPNAPNYFFEKQADGSYINNSKTGSGATWGALTDSYAMFDLTNVESDLNLIVDYDIDTPAHQDYRGYIYLTDSAEAQSYSDTSNRVLTVNGQYTDRVAKITIPHGQVSYLHFGYYGWADGRYYDNSFKINKLVFEKVGNVEDVNRDNIHYNEDDITTPEVEATDQYHFNYIDYDPFTWRDSSGNNNNAVNYGALLSENKTYYSFANNSYMTINYSNLNFNDFEESVYLEYSTTSSGNMVLYNGSDKERIAIGFYDTYIIVSQRGNALTYPKPADYNDGQKHNILVTHKSGTWYLYYDGVAQTAGTRYDSYSSRNGYIYLGKTSNNNYPYTGNIYQVRVFDQKIEPEDVHNDEHLVIYLNPTTQADRSIYMNNNANVLSTNAHSYLAYDLTNISTDKYLKINYSVSARYTDYAKILVNNTPDCPVSTDTNGLYLKTNVITDNQEVIVKLKKNQVNYVHLNFDRERWADSAYQNYFIINSMRVYDDYTSAELDGATTINTTNKSQSIFNLPVAKLNEDPSTVVMLKDVTTTSTIEIPEEKQMILDLNGHTLSSSVADFLINNKGNLTITDGKYSNEMIDLEERYEEQIIENQEKREQYEADLVEYEEYAGLCEGCEPSAEYILDTSTDMKAEYTGNYVEYTAPVAGEYKLQVWGAQGGYRSNSEMGGRGGYSEGIITLQENEKIYVYVGGSGNTGGAAGGFNGGGSKTTYPGGGGATDIRVNGNTLYNRIIVAGGGGSDGAATFPGKAGGGLEGISATEAASYCSGGEGATQTTAGTRGDFGLGGSGGYNAAGWGGGGFGGAGGGGWYGGGGANPDRSDDDRGGGGGSGFVYDGTNTVPTGYDVGTHVLTNAKTLDGTSNEIPTYDGTGTMTGNRGDGYARVTALNEEAIAEKRSQLPKTYNVKTKPVRNYYETESGKVFIPFHEDYLKTDTTTLSPQTMEASKITLTVQENNSLSEVYHINKMGSNIISGKAKVYYPSNAYGTLYVGFASSPDLRVDDYVEYKTFDIRTYNNKNIDFTVKYTGENDVYFKIILKSTSNNNVITAEINSLYFDTYNTAANYAGLAGNVTSGSYDIFLNNTGATLNIEDAILNINKASANAIVNRGNLTIGEMATINVNAGSAKGIYNETTGTMEPSPGKINVIGDNAYGIKNSSHDNIIENLNIETTKSNQFAVVNFSDGTDVVYNNLNLYGAGTGLYNLNMGDVTINDSTISSTSANAITFVREPTNYKFIINSSNIYNRIEAQYDTSARELIINNSNLYGTNGNIRYGLGTITIRDSYLENFSSSNNIINSGRLYMYDSNVVGVNAILYNYGDQQKSSYAYLKNTTFKLLISNEVYCIDNYGTLELDDSNIDTNYGSSQTGIYNRSGAYLNINGDSTISSKYKTAINNEGYLRIGTSYNNYADAYNFDYTGGIQEFTVPKTGNYKIEAWGAQGGYSSWGDGSQFLGANGAYTSGDIALTKGEKLYINVGSEGANRYVYSYYNIPYSTYLLASIYNTGGIFSGGATDISLSSEENEEIFTQGYSNYGSLKSIRSEESYLQRIMVAGGGGQKYAVPDANSVGLALSNSDGTVSQTTGYAFGYGNDLLSTNSLSGGSGYFGGTSQQGGTSYISGYLGAVAMDGSASNPKCTMAEAATDITCSYHNSGKIFTNTVMKAGNEEMPTHDGKGTMRGNFGHGFVKITYLDGEVTTDTVTDSPKIGASTTAITGKGVVEFLDGEITSQSTILNTAIDEIPDGYDLYLTNDGKTVKLKSKDSEPYVAQIGNVKYTSLDYAINAAEAGDEIIILEDLIEADSFDIDKNLTIDYNGHVIHAFNSEYLFKNDAKLKIYDSTNSPKTNGIYSDNLVYNNGELIIDNLQFSDQVSSATLIYNNSKVDIDNSVFAINAYDYKTNSQFLYNAENSEAKINNSTFNSLQSGYQSGGTFIDNYGSLEVKNTNYTHWSRGEGIVNRSTGELTLDNYKMTFSWGTTTKLVHNYNKLVFKNSNTTAYVYTDTGYITLENNTITGGEINIDSDSLMTIKSGTYSNTFSINGTGKSVDQNGNPIDQNDNPYSFIMEDGTINKTLNLYATGLKWIKGGSIIPGTDNAVYNTTSSKMILGINDGNVDPKESTKPIITGNKYAIYTTNYDFVIDFYDGILTGKHSTDAIFETTETGYQIHRDYENDKEIEYLKQEVVLKDVDTNTDYYSTNEVNTAISNGTINSGDTLQVVNDFVILELHDPIEIPTGFTLNFDLNNHVVEQDDEELFINNGTLIIDDSAYQSDPSNDSGVIRSKLGEIIVNNGTLTINGGGFEGERHSVISTVIENNGTLTINDGTFTKYYDDAGYYKVAMGSIIENNGIANILGGTYKVPSSFIESYYRRIDNNSADYLRLASVFKNNVDGTLTVTAGNFPLTTDMVWIDRDSCYRTDYYYNNSGELIENYGTATISDITSSNTHIGLNAGTLTLDNVTMDNIGYVNTASHPNLINTGDLVITDSSFETHSSFVNNTGNMDITNTTIDKKNDLVHYYYYNGTREGDTNLYRNDEDNLGYHKNSFVIRNNYNSAQDNVTNITGSTIYNRGSGEVIENNAIMSINNSTIESTTANNAINNKKILTIYGNSEITSTAAIGINNTNTATLNLGKPAIEDGEVSKTYPLITGETYGISNAGTFNFYDGYIRGKTHATSGNVTTTEAGYSFSNPTAAVDGYNVAYLDQIKVIRNVQIGEEYFTIAEAVAEASSGDTLQMISNDNVLNTAATIVIDKQLTLDLNGYTINQGNNILFRNESTFTINDSNTSGNNQGKIEVASGTVMLDNFGDLVINGGTYNTSSNRIIIKNEALTAEEIANNASEHTVTLQTNVNMNASDNTMFIENHGKMDIYNGVFLKNVNSRSVKHIIENYKELNVIDLNKDDDPNTSSNLTAPWIYSQGNTSGDSGDIYNASGATLNIYGGIFNNGGTYDQGSIAPDQVYIVYNDGTANIKNLDNYSFGIMRNHYGTASIKNSHFYNTVEFAINCNGGTISIEDTIFEMSGTRGDLYGTEYEFNLSNATLDNVTVINKSGITTGKASIGFSGTSIVRNSNIIVNNIISRSLGNGGTLTIENSTITMNHPFYNTGTINFVNSNLTSSSNGFTNDRVLNISGSSSVESTNGLGIINTTSNSVINLGNQDGVVDVTVPLIVGTTYGIDNSYTGAKINFYDGLVEGEGGPTAINGVITTAEGGYIPDYINNDASSDGKYQVKLKDGSASVVIIAKVGNISFSSQADPYVTATEALQLAINTAANSGRGVDLLQDITIDQNLTSSTAVTVYRNGHTETFEPGITATNITFTNGQAPLASLAKLLSNINGTGDDENNIVIYEMNDGSELTTVKTYELYLDGNLIGLNEEEAGIYRYSGNTNELRPVKGKIYINELTSGNYKLKSSDNKELDFSIDSDGNITGNVKKYNKTDGKSSTNTSVAELIIAIQTGISRSSYLLIIPMIILIIMILLCIKKNKEIGE